MKLIAVILLAITPVTGQMAALVGHDRVTATYPGFHRVEGDTTALAANGRYRGGEADAIVIRRVAILSSSQAAAFGSARAVKTALENENNYSDSASVVHEGISNQRRIRACGKPAYGFTSIRSISVPTVAEPMKWLELDVYVVQLVGHDVWQATYSGRYEPGIELTRGNSLIDFTSHFCVEQHYK